MGVLLEGGVSTVDAIVLHYCYGSRSRGKRGKDRYYGELEVNNQRYSSRRPNEDDGKRSQDGKEEETSTSLSLGLPMPRRYRRNKKFTPQVSRVTEVSEAQSMISTSQQPGLDALGEEVSLISGEKKTLAEEPITE